MFGPKKKSNGAMPPNPCGFISLVCTISVEVIETTAGLTRAATSANDGIVIVVMGPCAELDVAICCACDGRIIPKSALISTPKATEAMTIAMVDNKRFTD